MKRFLRYLGLPGQAWDTMFVCSLFSFIFQARSHFKRMWEHVSKSRTAFTRHQRAEHWTNIEHALSATENVMTSTANEKATSEKRKGPSRTEGGTTLEMLWTSNRLCLQDLGTSSHTEARNSKVFPGCFRIFVGKFPAVLRVIPRNGRRISRWKCCHWTVQQSWLAMTNQRSRMMEEH